MYVSLIDGASSRRLNYSEGHERVVDGLQASSIPATILRPTGFFVAMAALLDLARKGIVPVIGSGHEQTNPIHELDLAAAAAQAVENESAGVTEQPLGGPEIYTRKQIAELACRTVGMRPRLLHVPPWAVRASAWAIRPINPRACHFVLFAAHVMTHPCVAPRVGRRRLEEYFAAWGKR